MSRLILAIGLLLALCAAANAQDAPAASGINWANPESIASVDSDLGGFIDADLSSWAKTAQEAYAATDYAKCIRYSLALLRWDKGNSGLLYQTACCYGLLGNAELAALYLQRAVAAGYSDLGWASWDPDFAAVRGQAAFDSVFAGLQQAATDKQAGLGLETYVSATTLMRVRIHLPDGYDPAQPYPLIVGLHGYGASPENFSRLWERFPEHSAILAVPQAPYAMPQGTELGYSWLPPLDDAGPLGRQALQLTEQYICDTVAELQRRYNVSQVYLLGFSQGCALTYDTGLRHPELVDGLICFAGWLAPEWIRPGMLDSASGLPVFIGQGTQDRIIDPKESEAARDLLAQHGFDVTYFTFAGEHRVPLEAVEAAWAWIQEQMALSAETDDL
jgi:predicted esterase